MSNLDIVLTLKGRNQFGRVATSARKQIEGLAKAATTASLAFGKMPATMPALVRGTDAVARSTQRTTNFARELARRDREALREVKERERARRRENAILDRALRGTKQLTIEEARRTEKLRQQDRLLRQQARAELGIGRRTGINGDPDAPATNLAIAGGALTNAGHQIGRVNRAVFGGAIREFSNFEEAMADVAAKGGTEKIAEQTELARQLGRDTRFSAMDAAGGLAFLAQAGFDAESRIKALPPILDAATATSTDLATTADIASNVLTGFGMKASETTRLVDVLTTTANKSNTSFEQLGEAMANVAPLARSLGVSVEETAAMLGSLGDAGIQGGRAGTALKIAFTRVAAPTSKQSRDALNRLGVNKKFINENISDPQAIFRKIGQGLEGKSDFDRTKALKQIFGEESLSAVTALMQAVEQGGTFQKHLAENTAAAGAAAAGAAEKTKTLTASLERSKNALADVGIEFGKTLAPEMSKLSDTLAGEVLPAVQEFVKENPRMAKGIAGLMLGAQGLATVGGAGLNATAGVLGITQFFKQMRTGSMSVQAGVVNVGGAGAGLGGGAAGGGKVGALGRAGQGLAVVGAGVAGFGVGTMIDQASGATKGSSTAGISGFLASQVLGGGADALDQQGGFRDAAQARDRVQMARDRVKALEAQAEQEGLNSAAGGGITLARRFFSDTDEQLEHARADLRKETEASGVASPEMQGFNAALAAFTKAVENGLAVKVETDSGTKVAKVGGKGAPKRGSILGASP